MASTISLGGKGSSLSSSSVYKISTGIAQVRIDSSALERLSTGNQNPKTAQKKSSSLAIPQDLTIEETRASLTVLLKKLLQFHSSSTAIRMILPVMILESLNSMEEEEALEFTKGEIDLTEGERHVLENSCSPLIGICSVIEHKSSALSQIVDAVAALSCEALKADVSSFSSLDSEDKDAIAVASDLKVLLKGSNLLVGEEIEAVSKIPKIHGTFHDAVKNLRDVVKVELNSEKFGYGTKEALGTRLLALSTAIKNMAKCSMDRAKLSLDSLENEDIRNGLGLWYMRDTRCFGYDGDSLKDSYTLVVDKDYYKFAHLVNESLGRLYVIVRLEAMAAFFNLTGEELSNEMSVGEANEEKVVLGKGTSILVQFIKDRLLAEEDPEQWLKKPRFLLNPEDPLFACFSDKVKEILQSNEHKRLPKLPKVNRKELLAFVSWCCRK